MKEIEEIKELIIHFQKQWKLLKNILNETINILTNEKETINLKIEK
jgi:hypothetical protein